MSERARLVADIADGMGSAGGRAIDDVISNADSAFKSQVDSLASQAARRSNRAAAFNAASAQTVGRNAAGLNDAGKPVSQSIRDRLNSALDTLTKSKAASKAQTNKAASAAESKAAINSSENAVSTVAKEIEVKTGLTATDKLFGLTILAFSVYVLASFFATDGTEISINKITIIDSSTVEVEYDPPSKVGFNLCEGDEVTFKDGAADFTIPRLSGAKNITEIVNSTTFRISASLTSAGGVPYPPPPPAAPGASPSPVGSPVPSQPPTGSAYWGKATVTSTIASQFADSVGDTIGAVAHAAGRGVAAGLGGVATGLGLDDLLGGGGGDGGDGGDGQSGLCRLPIISSICNAGSTVKNVIIAICIIISIVLGAYLAYSLTRN